MKGALAAKKIPNGVIGRCLRDQRFVFVFQLGQQGKIKAALFVERGIHLIGLGLGKLRFGGDG